MVIHPQSKNLLTIVVMGRSGSGKGTQAEFLMERLGESAYHIETGKVMRRILQQTNATTIISRYIMEKGKLQPSWFGAFVWLKELIEGGHADRDLIFDGAPRKVSEAQLVDEVMVWHGRHLPIAVYVDASEDTVTKRLLARGRDDDTPFAIRNRMDFFRRDVQPVVEYYESQNRLIHIDGERPPEEVWKELDEELARRLGKLWPSRPKAKKK